LIFLAIDFIVNRWPVEGIVQQNKGIRGTNKGDRIRGTVTYFVNPDSRKIGGKFPQANNLRRFGLQKPAGFGLGHNR
jgi:hypothetical protein